MSIQIMASNPYFWVVSRPIKKTGVMMSWWNNLTDLTDRKPQDCQLGKLLCSDTPQFLSNMEEYRHGNENLI